MTSQAKTSESAAEVSSKKTSDPSKDSNHATVVGNQITSLSLRYYSLSTSESPNPASSQVDEPIHLSKIDRCVLYLPVPSTGMTIRDVQECLLICGPVNGAAHLTEAADTVMAISTRQLRMHNCHDCVVYLQCSSRPIIEECKNIRFSPLPKNLVSPSLRSVWKHGPAHDSRATSGLTALIQISGIR